MPALFRVLFGFGLAIALVSVHLRGTILTDDSLASVVMGGFRELGLGLTIALAFQIVFGALQVAGRTIDIQAGYGLATLIDPTFQTQTPLIGSLFAYAAGAMFFAFNGHAELLKLFAASLDTVPLGSWTMPHSIERLVGFVSVTFISAFGVAGGAVLALFLTDLLIALLSRTLPQMNVLILGFQAKAIVLLLVLPMCFGVGGILLVRMMTLMLHAIPKLI